MTDEASRRRRSYRNHGQKLKKEGVEGGVSGGGDDSKGAKWATEDRTRKREALSINVTESHIKAMENNNSRPSNQKKAATG